MTRLRAAWLGVALASAAACGGGKGTAVTAPHETTEAARYVALDPDGGIATASEEVTFTSDGHSVPGTLVRPTTPGRHPALVLMAGSGPTDRDWNSPLLPGKNGSAKLLAEALAARGVIVLRFDKASVGGNKASLENVTFDLYRNEGQAALAFLRARPDVASERLYLAGHSEGGMHAVRVAAAEGDKLAGLLLLSTSGRSMASIILTQLTPQLKTAMPDRADALLAAIKQAFTDFLAGKAVDPKQVTQIPQLQALLQAVFNPATATLARSMVGWESRPEVAKLELPIFVYNGAHDIQVDPDLDARPLAAANPRAELFIAPEADHVLKHETRSITELRSNLMLVQTEMNAESRSLDPVTLEAITDWLIAHPD